MAEVKPADDNLEDHLEGEDHHEGCVEVAGHEHPRRCLGVVGRSVHGQDYGAEDDAEED